MWYCISKNIPPAKANWPTEHLIEVLVELLFLIHELIASGSPLAPSSKALLPEVVWKPGPQFKILPFGPAPPVPSFWATFLIYIFILPAVKAALISVTLDPLPTTKSISKAATLDVELLPNFLK